MEADALEAKIILSCNVFKTALHEHLGQLPSIWHVNRAEVEDEFATGTHSRPCAVLSRLVAGRIVAKSSLRKYADLMVA